MTRGEPGRGEGCRESGDGRIRHDGREGRDGHWPR